MTEADPTSKRSTWKVEAAVAAGLGLVVFCCWWFFVREPPRFNVVLISIDSLRYDHVGCYGYGKKTTPALDALAARGARFETAHSTTSWTLPAHMALMTGLTDDLHGMVVDYVKLDPNRKLLAEAFKDAGYDTGGVYGGIYLDKLFGFDRGFRSYVNCGVDLTPGKEASAEHLSHRVPTAPKTQAKAEEFLARRVADKPFFLFMHHWDVHFDYIAPREYVDRFANGYRGELDVSNFPYNNAINADMAPEDLAYLKACYDAEIAFVDDHLARLFAKLDEAGLRDNTFVVVTADHGEEFFDHGNKGHRLNLHEETLRIPLIVAGPGIAPRAIENPVRLIDVMPTLLDLCGLPPEPDCLGVSLAPLLRGENPAELQSLPILAELTYVPKQPNGEYTGDYEKHEATSLNQWKLIEIKTRAYDATDITKMLDFAREEVKPMVAHLYDLATDPRETIDRAATPTDAWARLWDFHRGNQVRLAELRKSLKSLANPQPLELSANVREQLNGSGYLGGMPQLPPPPPQPPADDPKAKDKAKGAQEKGEDSKR